MLSFPGLVFPYALFATRDFSVLTPLLFWANYSVLKLLLVGRTVGDWKDCRDSIAYVGIVVFF